MIIIEWSPQRAKKDIEENLSRMAQFFVEMDLIYCVIGRERETIPSPARCAQRQFIWIKNDGEVVVSGNKRSQEDKKENLACKTIDSLLEKTTTFLSLSQMERTFVLWEKNSTSTLLHFNIVINEENGELLVVELRCDGAKRKYTSHTLHIRPIRL